MMREKNTGGSTGRAGIAAPVLAILLCLVFLLGVVVLASAAQLHWSPPAKYVGGETIDQGTIAKMRYYIRTVEPNGRSVTPDAKGQYYLGETTAPATAWPADNNIEGLLQGYGQAGKSMTFTLSAAYTDNNGKTQESATSPGYVHLVPFASHGQTEPPAGMSWY